MKVCKVCGIEKPLEEFHINNQSKDGHQSKCKDCFHEHYLKHQEEYRKRRDKWHEENLEKHLELNRQYYHDNKERLDAERLEYRKRNADYFKNYLADKPEKRKLYSEIYGKRRRSRLEVAEGSHTQEELHERLLEYEGKCWICGEDLQDKVGWDHVKPIAKGGSNWISNLRPICVRCNSTKGPRWFGEGEENLEKLKQYVLKSRSIEPDLTPKKHQVYRPRKRF